MMRFHCGESFPTCGRCLTNGVGDSWPPAKLSHWGTEGCRGFNEPVGYHEKPLPRGYGRSLMETLYRDVFVGRARAGRTSSSAIPSFWFRWNVWLNRKHGATRNLPYAGYARALGIWPLN